MEKTKKTWKLLSWNTLWILLISVILNGIVWIGFHGVPLIGIPKKEDVERITISSQDMGAREITDEENIELLVKAANLLNYKFWGEKGGSPAITITYHLKNEDDIRIGANSTTMWWHGKSHALKQTEVFVNIIQGLFFDKF